MSELHLQRNANSLIVTLRDQSVTVPLERVLPAPNMWEQIYDDAATYGRELFERTFAEETMRTQLAEMPDRERLVLLADDPLVAQIPWEYLRDHNNRLLASRLTLVRSISDLVPTTAYTPAGPLEIVALTSAPIDGSIHINAEQEWESLVEIVTNLSPAKTLNLKRLCPPTRSTLADALSREGSSIVHFMGHGTYSNGKAYLAFEDVHGRQQLVDAANLKDALNEQVFLVILNGYPSTTLAPTNFGAIAHSLVQLGIPYALSTKCTVPEEAASVLNQELLHSLLQGATLEEAVMHTRSVLQEQDQSSHPDWLAGLPVLYTSQREHPTAPLILTDGQPTISPDPQHLEQFSDLIALPLAEHFLGRVDMLSGLLDQLLSPDAHGFFMLHGVGGIGKTSLARVAAERVGWYYDDRVLAISFETFATLDANNQRIVNEAFIDRFYTRLAQLYQLDPAQYSTVTELQQAILRERDSRCSLLILDNIETLLDTLSRPVAQDFASFLVRLKDGDGVTVLTSRIVAPADWGIETNKIITLDGLAAESGAELFQVSLQPDRRQSVSREACLALSQRVSGHPLSIRLLAGYFADETMLDLATFLSNSNDELAMAERSTPESLADPEQQKTFYACMDYSIKHLPAEYRTVLDSVSIFQAPFTEEFASIILDDTERTPLHIQHLVDLGLLNRTSKGFEDVELMLFELHPMVRWYIELHRSDFATEVKERYGELCMVLVEEAAQPEGDYENNMALRTLICLSLVDFEAAIAYLEPEKSSVLGYHLAHLYYKLGQVRRTLDLYEQALQTYQELGDVGGVVATQNAMANVLVQQGKVADALKLYEQVLQAYQTVGNVHEIAMIQITMGQLLMQAGEQQQGLKLIWDAYKKLEDRHFTPDVEAVQQLLLWFKNDILGRDPFNQAWQQAIKEVQPEWLHDAQPDEENAGDAQSAEENVRDTQPEEEHTSDDAPLSEEAQRALSEYLNADGWNATRQVVESQQALLFKPEIEQLLESLIQYAQSQEDERKTKLFEVHLTLLRKCKSEGIESAFTQFHTEQTGGAGTLSDEAQQALSAYLNAKNWHATRQIVEKQQALLFQPEVEQFIEQLIKYAQSQEEQQRETRVLEVHLALLRDCKNRGIAATFAQLEQEQEATSTEPFPFPEEIINQSVAALLEKPETRTMYLEYLSDQIAEITDEQYKALLSTIQRALSTTESTPDPSTLGTNLDGVYRRAWDTIVATAEAGRVDPQLFETIVDNTLAVFGPASDHRSEWRGVLVDLRNNATEQGKRYMADFVDNVIGLLDAHGNPEGLGMNLLGVFARIWQAIVTGLAS